MRPVLILQHGADIPPGHLGTALEAAGVPFEVVALDEGEPIPEGEWSGVVSLGGVMGAYEEAEHPWLVAEKEFLAETVESGVPVLGICLGAQTLADALGGRAFRSEAGAEIGLIDISLTAAGYDDPVAAGLDGRVLAWHSDTFDLPPGATLLATSDRFPHAFRCGSAVAIQSHPEADPSIVAGWMANPSAADQLRDGGIAAEALAEAVHDAADATAAIARRVFDAWAAELLA